MDEELLVSVVLRVNLVVKLQHVEIDLITDLFVNSVVSAVHVVRSLEIRSLRAMGKDHVWSNNSSNCLSERNQPSLAFSLVHCLVVLPINVSTVEVVCQNEISEIGAASDWI